MKKYNPEIESLYKNDIYDIIDVRDPSMLETPVIETVDNMGLPLVYNIFEIDPNTLAKNENGMIPIRYQGFKHLEMMLNDGLIYLFDPKTMALDYEPETVDSVVPYTRRGDPIQETAWGSLAPVDQ